MLLSALLIVIGVIIGVFIGHTWGFCKGLELGIPLPNPTVRPATDEIEETEDEDEGDSDPVDPQTPWQRIEGLTRTVRVAEDHLTEALEALGGLHEELLNIAEDLEDEEPVPAAEPSSVTIWNPSLSEFTYWTVLEPTKATSEERLPELPDGSTRWDLLKND